VTSCSGHLSQHLACIGTDLLLCWPGNSNILIQAHKITSASYIHCTHFRHKRTGIFESGNRDKKFNCTFLSFKVGEKPENSRQCIGRFARS
jgi:hypothetical protein